MKRRSRSNSRLSSSTKNECRDLPMDVVSWGVDEVCDWLDEIGLAQYRETFRLHIIDGLALLLLNESDLKQDMNIKILGHVKRIYASIANLQNYCDGCDDSTNTHSNQCPLPQNLRFNYTFPTRSSHLFTPNIFKRTRTSSDSQSESNDGANLSSSSHYKNATPWKSSGVATNLKPQYFRTVVSCLYMFLVTWITAIVMVFVHDRVPDKERHPPLPDIFLDNVPHISWAFQLCEVTILILSVTWIIILYFHKHRSILMRRFSALSGSVFLLRCSTMFITSLSVPGHHLECSPRGQSDIWTKFQMASVIWKGGGLSIKGVRSCGDYMFSGHTTALTLLNFFITEYTPRRMYYLHIISWVLNTFGIFFILAAHEHYSIDVFIGFYITSRMFLYYHSLANNRALHQRDSFRTKIWFPMFSYFEAHIDGIVPNESTNPLCRHNLVSAARKFAALFDRTIMAFVELARGGSPFAKSKTH